MNVVTSVDGKRVVELEGFDPGCIEEARAAGAQLLWIHTNDDLAVHGLSRRGGYVRMHADEVPVRAGRDVPMLDEGDYARVLAGAYAGLWGHKQVRADASPQEGEVVVGTPDLGLCRVRPSARLLDGPGVLPGARSPDAYASLLLAACAALGPGPADLDSWGDADEVLETYEDLGFDVVERVQGWELALE